MSDDSITTGTARTVAFRCPADLDALLNKTAENLGVSVSRAIDGLLREGIDARASAQIARRLEGAVARLEFQTRRMGGQSRFDDEATILGFALLEFERGERHLTGMLNAEVFADPIHRSTWKTLSFLRDENLVRRDDKTDLPDTLERMCREDAASAEVAAIVGSLKAYFEIIIKLARWREKMPSGGKALVADAIRGVVGEALQQLVEPDSDYESDFGKGREISLVKLAKTRGEPPLYGTVHVAAHVKKRQNRKKNP